MDNSTQPPPLPTHLYPHTIQLRLFQSLIFLVPLLFCIIFFLLFYLFYLKRMSTLSPSPQTFPQGSPYSSSYGEEGVRIFKGRLPIILFGENESTRDSQCSVCLGEYQMKEELHQLPICKHVFHVDCIRCWLYSSSNCPICRCSITAAAAAAATSSHGSEGPPAEPPLIMSNDDDLNQRTEQVQLVVDGDSIGDSSRAQHVVVIDRAIAQYPISETVVPGIQNHNS